MQRATRLLKNNVEVGKIAELLGYDSEVAFRKAFKREVGMPRPDIRSLGNRSPRRDREREKWFWPNVVLVAVNPDTLLAKNADVFCG